MAVFRNPGELNLRGNNTAAWWKDILLILGACLVGNVTGALTSSYIASCIVNAMIEREGPVGAGDLRLGVFCSMCCLGGGLLGPFLTCLVPTRTPRFLAKAGISLVSGIAWAVLFFGPSSQ